MDPVSIVSIINASLGLALKCSKVATDLHAFFSQLKQAELSVLEVVNDCQMIEIVLKRIQAIVELSEARIDEDIYHQVESTLHLGSVVVASLEADLASVMSMEQDPGFREKVKIMWNSGVIKTHQDRITRQLTAMTCLLNLMELYVSSASMSQEDATDRPPFPRPSLSIQRETLLEKTEVFRKAESSAWTIVMSRESTSIRDRDSLVSTESAELEYKRLSFEDQLFTAAVYKRNFRPKALLNPPKLADMTSLSRPTGPHRNALDDQKSSMLCLQLGKGTDSTELQRDTDDSPALNPEPLPPLVCIKCCERFTKQIEHQRHLQTLHGHQIKSCRQCDAHFFSVPGWIEHSTRQHMGGSAAIMNNVEPPWVHQPRSSPKKNRLGFLLQELVRLDKEVKDASWDLPPPEAFLRTILVTAVDAENSWDLSQDNFRSSIMFACRTAVLKRISCLLCQHDPFPSGFLIGQAVSKDKTTFFDILDHWSEFRVYSMTENGDTLMVGYPGVEEAMDKLKQDCLLLACLKDDTFLAEGLLMRSTDIHGSSDAEEAARHRPIDIALARGNLTLVRLLVRYGICLADAFPPTPSLSSPIFQAITKNQPDIVGFLLEGGQSTQSRDKQGYQPLHLACLKGYIDIVQQLVHAGASVTSATTEEGFLPVHCVINGNLDNETGKVLLQYLVDNGADLNAVALHTNRSPLIMACELRKMILARFLIELGA